MNFYKQQCEKMEQLGMTTPKKALEKYEALQNQVAKETAKEIFEQLSKIKLFDGYSEFICEEKDFHEIFEEYGVEVEE